MSEPSILTAGTEVAYWLGLDLGGTSVKGIALTDSNTRLPPLLQEYDLRQPLSFAHAVRSAVEQATAAWGRPRGIGLSAPGIAAPDNRSIAYMPGRFPGLEGLIWGDFLARPEGVPVLNDANAALLGEVRHGAARGARNALLFTLGTGVGGAALVEGRLARGHTGKAGHLGHVSLDSEGRPDICNTPGSLEDAIGNHNIRERTGGRFATTHELIQAVEAGDDAARRLWIKSVKALAAAIASLANVLDPEVVIIGGGIARCGKTLFDPLQQFLDAMEWRPGGAGLRLVPAELGEWAGAWGAAAQAREHSDRPGH